MLVPQFATFDGSEKSDGTDQMLVHRIVVVHIELHQRNRMPECRYKSAEHARFVHSPECPLRGIAGGKNRKEQPVRFGVLPEVRCDEVQRTCNRSQCLGMDIEPFFICELIYADQVARIASERALARIETTVLDEELVLRASRREKSGHQPGGLQPRLGVLLFERGAENARDVANVLGDEKIGAHEVLDGVAHRFAREAHPARHLRLYIEGKALFGAAGKTMEAATHVP